MSESPAIEPADFRHALGHFPTGVTSVTAASENGLVGVAIGSFFSVSLDPALVGFCIGTQSGSWAGIESAGAFCVNVMADDQGELCGRMASKAEDKFEGVDHRPAATGSPILEGSLAYIDCVLDGTLDGGDHHIVIGRVQELGVLREDALPLLFFKGGYGSFAG